MRTALLLLLLIATPAAARDSLGMFSNWGALRDSAASSGGARCYAIAMAEPSTMQRDFQPYATVAIWPGRGVRNQLHLRLSRRMQAGARITLTVGDKSFSLTGGGADAWTVDQRMDAAVVAAMRSAKTMQVASRDAKGRGFSNTYPLAGVATAMDAAAIGCAKGR